MIDPVRRRVFIALVGSAIAWPLGASAQTPAPPVIGFLNSASPGPFAPLLAGFHQGLKDGGFVEGRNVAIEYRWAEGQYDRLPALAANLVQRKVAVIAATGGTVSAKAASGATSTIPIFFVAGANPVEEGLVTSFGRPGGNVTGVSTYTSELAPKRLELLRELLPKVRKIATLSNPKNVAIEMQELEEPARIAGLKMLAMTAATESEFEPAFAQAVAQQAEAILISADPFFNSKRTQLIALAARHRMPAAYPWREYALAGGMMSYGTSLPALYRQTGLSVSRILKGERPANMPVQNPNKFELVINLRTAKELGVTVPRIMIARADEVID